MRRGRSSRDRGGPSRPSSYRCRPIAAPGLPDAGDSCRSFPEQSARFPEHHHDEERKGEHVSPFEVKEEPAHRNELRKDERRDEAAEHVAKAAEHADEESDRTEGEADGRVDVVLKDEQARGEPGERTAERGGEREDE